MTKFNLDLTDMKLAIKIYRELAKKTSAKTKRLYLKNKITLDQYDDFYLKQLRERNF